MITNLLTLSTVKTYLGLTDITYDSQITAMIPIVSSDVRRILNIKFDKYIPCSFTDASTSLFLTYYMRAHYPYNSEIFPVGTVVYHPNLPDDTYVSEYDPMSGNYTLSATPDDTGTYVYPTITISQWVTISKMIFYRIGKLNTKMPELQVKSKSIGPVSVTYGGMTGVNKKWDYPQQLIDDLGTPFARIG